MIGYFWLVHQTVFCVSWIFGQAVLGPLACCARGQLPRRVVVRERGGTPFRQILWSRNAASANIVGYRWNANTEAFRQITSYSLGWPSISLFSDRNCPLTRDGINNVKNFSGGGRPLPHAPTPSTATRRARGRKLPRCWYLGLGNRSPCNYPLCPRLVPLLVSCTWNARITWPTHTKATNQSRHQSALTFLLARRYDGTVLAELRLYVTSRCSTEMSERTELVLGAQRLSPTHPTLF